MARNAPTSRVDSARSNGVVAGNREVTELVNTVSFILVHSPMLAPTTWQHVAVELRAAGHEAQVPSLAPAIAGPGPYYRAIADLIVRVTPISGVPVTVVGHSDAGGILPTIIDELHGAGVTVDRAIFVDADLPHPGQSWFQSVSEERAEKLQLMAIDGRLPPWHTWLPYRELARLIRDSELRTEFVGLLPRLPLSYFEEAAPPSAHWPPAHLTYIHLGDAYHKEHAEAERLGWTTRRNQMDHLAPVTRPAEVAGLILESIC